MELRIRLVQNNIVVLGPGRADLLQHIAATGSIAAAGRQMGMSYKRAWALVEIMNQLFTTPLVEASKGGPGGGGARLTVTGTTILAAYRDMEAAARAASGPAIAAITAALPVPPNPNKV
jgi:molybdate transport system regulatory protein